MAKLEGRLFPEEGPEIRPLVQRMPADWTVQFVRSASSIVLEVRVVIPGGPTERATFNERATETDGVVPSAVAKFLEGVRTRHAPNS